MSTFSDLPQEVILDILTWLPPKSVGQCRCVSKSWRTLLSQPSFVRANLHQTRTTAEELLILKDVGLYFARLSNTYQTSNQIIIDPTPLRFTDSPLLWTWVHGSCDGLVLVQSINHRLFVMNPVTRETREVPYSPFGLDPHDINTCHRYGFGNDSASDDYKIVSLSDRGTDNGASVCVYSLKTGSWKRAESSPYNHYEYRIDRWSGVFVNGYIHWIVRSIHGYVIAAFDLAEEKFREVPYPSIIQNDRLPYHKLRVLNGCLSAIDESQMVIREMREYGNVDSWYGFGVRSPCKFVECFLGQDHAVSYFRNQHFLYDVRRGIAKNIVIQSDIHNIRRIKGSFVVSLVSPHGGN